MEPLLTCIRLVVFYGKVLQKLEYALSDTFQVCCYHADTAETADDGENKGDRRVIDADVFRQAAAIVGVHGAGLSNVLFTAAGTQAIDGSAASGAGTSALRASSSTSAPSCLRQKLIEIVPGASSFHTEYALLAGALGMEHHAYVVPDIGWGDDVQVPSPSHLAAVVRAALLPEEAAKIAARDWDSMFDKLHGPIRRSHLSMVEEGVEPDFHDVKPFRDRYFKRRRKNDSVDS